MLFLEKVSENSKNLDALYLLSKEAFPSKEEYLKPKNLLKMQKAGQIVYYSIFDDLKFVGFIVIKIFKDMVYLFFFAVEPHLRNSGYGSRTLKLLKETYPDFKHVVDLELVDEGAKNNLQRISRRKFYLKNGYYPTKKGLEYFNTKYEILSSNEDFEIEVFKELMSYIDLSGSIPKYFVIEN